MPTDGSVEKNPRERFLVPSVSLPYFATVGSNTILTILIVEIAFTLLGSSSPAAVGLVGQISTLNLVGETVAAIFMTFLTVRVKEKSLFLTGIMIIVATGVGNFFAPTLAWMEVFYFLEGLGTVIVTISGLTMIGNRLPQTKKAKAVGYVYSALFLALVAGPPIVNLITGFAGWRYSYLFFVMPTAAVCSLIAFLGIPANGQGQQAEQATTRLAFVNSLKKVVRNRSAVTCAVAQLFFVGPSIGLFTTPFFATQFSANVAARSYILMAASSVYVVVFLFSGSLIKKLGSKVLAAGGALIHGVLLVGLFSAPSLLISLVFHFSAVFFSALAFFSMNCLTLDQVPDSRGTMVSVSRIFSKMGDAAVPAIGGLLLVLFASYQAMAVVLAAMDVMAAVFFIVTRDPNKP
ncbi:MAG TPA: MFS transporter [Candidatus Sulfotelmatobacter sp.]|nr:MFS transporter [Candidatus Sulfotelmatobacter sp.]